MAFITVPQLLDYYDIRVIQQYASDSGTPITANDLPSNTKLLEILGAASEVIAAAALVGARYSPTQLQDLSESTTTGYLLRRLTADIAMAMIVGRRVRGVTEVDKVVPARAWAEQQLDLLRTGTHLFPGTEDLTAPAGLPSQADMMSPNNPNRINTFTVTANRVFPFSCFRRPNGNCC